MTPLGVRHNNPGNLRPGPHPWVGELEPDYRGYCVFDTPENGIRAAMVNLVNQQRLHSLRTVRAIVEKYAPPQDNNDTEEYVKDVCRALNVKDDQELDLEDKTTLLRFVLAIFKHENGAPPSGQWYSTDVLARALRRALA